MGVVLLRQQMGWLKMRGGTARLRDTRLQLAGLRVHVMRDIINCSVHFYCAGLTCWFAGVRVHKPITSLVIPIPLIIAYQIVCNALH